jgi:hypothetical protein
MNFAKSVTNRIMGFVFILMLSSSITNAIQSTSDAAPYIGIYDWTWNRLTADPPPSATLGVAFSGYVDVDLALVQSAKVAASLTGDKYLDIGGGDTDGGFWTAEMLTKLNTAITSGRLSAYSGVCYDVEVGDTGLASAFAASFAVAKLQGLKVLVTVSHSAPYGFLDKVALMNSFFANGDVDVLSPQLYTTGEETANSYDWDGVPFTAWSTAKAAVVLTIVQSTMYPEGQATFLTSYNVTTSGYIQWAQSATP